MTTQNDYIVNILDAHDGLIMPLYRNIAFQHGWAVNNCV